MNDELAKAQVRAFLDTMQEEFGLSDDDMRGVVRQLVVLQRRTEFARRMGEWTAKSVITLLVAAFFSGVAWAFIHFIQDVRS